MAAISSLVLSDPLPSTDRNEEADTPTTPRPGRFPVTFTDEPGPAVVEAGPVSRPSAVTGTTAQTEPALRNVLNHQNDAMEMTTNNDDALSSTMDVDEEHDPPSDGEADQGDAGDTDPASRKKKGQRFFCTGYPPCNLSFTRSEHLARHIRKHTGERPFQCHCNRRFSRLDNLRQHAQTVHVNEEIPTDSLAATGTRFQRQIRTDRVRPTGRPRTGTTGSAGGHSRGHSRNLSTSSVGSTSSNYSIVTDAKRRPPPLIMANDGSRPAMGVDGPQTPPPHYRGFNDSGMSTPTSAQFSTTPGSPSFLSSIGSPVSSHARLSGPFFGARAPSRRLSVPSGPNPMQGQSPHGYPPPFQGHMGPPGSSGSQSASVFASPMSAAFSVGPGQHASSSEDWRRRTWHPSTFPSTNFTYARPATSGLTYSQTPDAPQPAQNQNAIAAAGQAPRLPGIESFDHVQNRPLTPPRRQPSPMHIDSTPPEPRFSSMPNPPAQEPRPRPVSISWETPRPSQYPELDDPKDRGHLPGTWSQPTLSDIQSVGSRHHESRRPDMGPPSATAPQHHQQMAREALDMGKRSKRQAWYNGPIPSARRTSPDSSSSDGVPTPGMTAVEVHPMIMPSNGYMEVQHASIPQDGPQNICLAPAPYIDAGRRPRTASFSDRASNPGDMQRLEALVAVATSSDSGRR